MGEAIALVCWFIGSFASLLSIDQGMVIHKILFELTFLMKMNERTNQHENKPTNFPCKNLLSPSKLHMGSQ
jgi:hypothetical protein